jgi:integrase
VPHHPEPFYHSARKGWFVQVGRRQIALGLDPDPKRDRRTGRPIPSQEILDRYHETMRRRDELDGPRAPAGTSPLVVVVVDQFLEWVERRKAKRTYEWYQRHCQAFAKSIPRDLTVAQLKPFHLTGLCDAHPEWSPTTKHGLCRAVQRALRWAARQGTIDRSPLGDVEKPEPQDRDLVLTPEEYAQVIGMVGGPFRDLLAMAWESGIRPQEIRVVEARHLDLENGRNVFPVKESKGKKLPRVVYLTNEALEIARRMVAEHPGGPIFRNSDGAPWTRYAINCAFIRLQVAFGRQVMKERGISVPGLPRFRRSRIDPAELKRAKAEHEQKVRGRRRVITRLALEHGKKLHLRAFPRRCPRRPGNATSWYTRGEHADVK